MASSFSASRSVFTAHGVAADSLDLPCLAATGRGQWESGRVLRSRSLSRPWVYVAITGAEGRGQSEPLPGLSAAASSRSALAGDQAAGVRAVWPRLSRLWRACRRCGPSAPGRRRRQRFPGESQARLRPVQSRSALMSALHGKQHSAEGYCVGDVGEGRHARARARIDRPRHLQEARRCRADAGIAWAQLPARSPRGQIERLRDQR